MHGRIFCVAGLICSIAATAAAAPGTPALERARQSWDDAAFDKAEREYREALDKGGLDRASTLECWVHVGAARSILGKKSGALAAFRMALFIDDNFEVPREAGKKAVGLAETARRQVNRIGTLRLSVSAPTETSSGDSFAVNVLVDDAQASVITRFSMHVMDTTTHKTYDFEQAAAAVAHFRVPPSMTLPGASLRVEVAALDDHDNQLGTATSHVTVRDTPITETHPSKDLLRTSGGGFWSSPWPYILGGAALAAGGATAAWFLLKPPDQVSVGPATMQTH